MTVAPRFLVVAVQLGLQLQAGHDMSSMKDSMRSIEDDVSLVKDGVKAVEEGMHLQSQASWTVSCKQQVHTRTNQNLTNRGAIDLFRWEGMGSQNCTRLVVSSCMELLRWALSFEVHPDL